MAASIHGPGAASTRKRYPHNAPQGDDFSRECLGAERGSIRLSCVKWRSADWLIASTRALRSFDGALLEGDCHTLEFSRLLA
jgi:hypothetical protein